MPVEYTIGDALSFPKGATVLAHGCNTLPGGGHMGSGIARLIADRWPVVIKADQEAAKAGGNVLGQFSVATVEDEKRVVNLYTQERVGTDRRQVDYEAVYVGLSHLRDALEAAFAAGRTHAVCMPWIGCGLAGGSKVIVGAMIEDVFGPSPVRAIVVTHPKDVKLDLSVPITFAAPVVPTTLPS